MGAEGAVGVGIDTQSPVWSWSYRGSSGRSVHALRRPLTFSIGEQCAYSLDFLLVFSSEMVWVLTPNLC